MLVEDAVSPVHLALPSLLLRSSRGGRQCCQVVPDPGRRRRTLRAEPGLLRQLRLRAGLGAGEERHEGEDKSASEDHTLIVA